MQMSKGKRMASRIDRRRWLSAAAALAAGAAASRVGPAWAARDPRWGEATSKGLDWLRRNQSSRGHWNTNVYPTALAALAGTAMNRLNPTPRRSVCINATPPSPTRRAAAEASVG